MLGLVADLVQKGIRVVVSSHLLPDVEAVCDQVAVLDSGRLVRSGRLADMLDGAPLAFEIRVKGPQESFLAALEARGARWTPRPHGLVHVLLPQAGSHMVFEVAAATGCQLRQILPAKAHLDDVFAKSVPGRSRADR
jgi:ABC-2 type transport system ATP-binding protein